MQHAFDEESDWDQPFDGDKDPCELEDEKVCREMEEALKNLDLADLEKTAVPDSFFGPPSKDGIRKMYSSMPIQAATEDDARHEDSANGEAGELVAQDAATTPSVGGRPPALGTFERGRVCTLLALGMSQRQAAAMVGCSQSTVSRAVKGDPTFAAEVEQAKQKAQVMPLIHIASACRTSWRAAVWLLQYLERRQSNEEFDPDKVFSRTERTSE